MAKDDGNSKGGSKPPVFVPGVMSIRTVYYLDKQVTRVNRAGRANNAVPLCVKHMQLNHYGATIAEVFDEGTGELHAVVKRHIGSNRLEILFQREVKEGM